jgi:hypothetical protein
VDESDPMEIAFQYVIIVKNGKQAEFLLTLAPGFYIESFLLGIQESAFRIAFRRISIRNAIISKGADKRGESQISIKAGKAERTPSLAQQISQNQGEECGEGLPACSR